MSLGKWRLTDARLSLPDVAHRGSSICHGIGVRPVSSRVLASCPLFCWKALVPGRPSWGPRGPCLFLVLSGALLLALRDVKHPLAWRRCTDRGPVPVSVFASPLGWSQPGDPCTPCSPELSGRPPPFLLRSFVRPFKGPQPVLLCPPRWPSAAPLF